LTPGRSSVFIADGLNKGMPSPKIIGVNKNPVSHLSIDPRKCSWVMEGLPKIKMSFPAEALSFLVFRSKVFG
jgi:hypothetical protein